MFTAQCAPMNTPIQRYLGMGALHMVTMRIYAGEAQAYDFTALIEQWAAPFSVLGEHNKLLKQHGPDAQSKRAA